MKRHKLKTRHGLNQFVELLTKAAEAACHDEELRPRERALFLRQGDIFSTAVAELIEILKDHQDPEVREARLFSLYKAVGSAAVIASHRMIDPVGNRRRATPATKGTVAQAQELALLWQIQFTP
jgi:hypothetical protein